jgi:PHD/YefM family antitoxin component YafN of YafNO toxin-antitoxin module
MLVDTDRIMPITRFQKELTQKVRELSQNGEPLYILKNNKMEAVMIPFQEYEYLRNLEEMFEHFEVGEIIEGRRKTYDPNKNLTWDTLREEE